MLSGSLMPRRIPRFVGSFTSSVEESEGEGGLVVAAVLNALYSVVPSGEKMLPPTFCVVLMAEVKVNGALALFCCAITASVAVSYMVNPAMKREPSGAIEITVLCPAVVRLRRITPEATSYTKMYVLAAVGVITPTMNVPSGVRSSLPGKVVVGRPVAWAGSGASVVVSAGTATSVRVRATGSKTCSVFCGTPAVTPVPTMATSTRPSMPVSTPCGVEGSVWLYAMRLAVRSIAYSAEGGPLAVTYRKLPSIDMAPASGVLPVAILATTWFVV